MAITSFEVIYRDDKNRRPEKGQVQLFTDSGGWNDFGFHVGLMVRYLDNKNIVRSRSAMFGLLNDSEEKLTYSRRFKGVIEGLSLGDGTASEVSVDKPEYFVMLSSINEYRRIVKELGIDQAKSLLLSINDLVAYKYTDFEWHSKALNTEVFRRAFVRNSEPFYAYHNAASVLNGVGGEDLKAISSSLNLEFKLSNFSNPHVIPFRFDCDRLIPKRINVLIGSNGLGKSQALYKITEALLGVEEEATKLSVDSNKSSRPMLNRLIVLGTPGETGVGFPIVDIEKQKVYYRYLDLGGCWPEVGTLGEELVKLVRNTDSIKDKSRWDIFIESISGILPIDRLVVSLEGGNELSIKELRKNIGEQDKLDRWAKVANVTEIFIEDADEYELYPLSSGQLTFFKFSLLLANFIENGSYVIMDEPETHLHPQFISQFIDLLDSFLESTGSYAIIATHSPYIVREMTRDQVHLFREQRKDSIVITNPRLRTFGADIDAISQFVFEENSSSRLTSKILKKLKGMEFEAIDNKLGGELSIAALMDIKRRVNS